jgi:hypothetical protein
MHTCRGFVNPHSASSSPSKYIGEQNIKCRDVLLRAKHTQVQARQAAEIAIHLTAVQLRAFNLRMRSGIGLFLGGRHKARMRILSTGGHPSITSASFQSN